MPLSAPASPQVYNPSIESPEDDEAKTTHELAETMLSISRKTYEDGGRPLRSVHAKSHGLIKATFKVRSDLPPALAQGIFAKPASYEMIGRLSTTPGDLLPDSIATPRGLAIKLLNVEGARLSGSEDKSSQDFIGVNAKSFQAPSGKAFLGNLELLAKTTDRIEGIKHVAATFAHAGEAVVEAVGGESPLLRAVGGEAEHHILGESFFGELPIRYGRYIAKFAIVPVSPALTALTGQPIGESGEDKLRSAVSKFFAESGGKWEFRVQLCTNLDEMPVEHNSKAWDEEKSPFLTVADIEAPAQPIWSVERAAVADEALGFSPWHGIVDHQPLGAIMRMRKLAYAEAQRFRGERNGRGIIEPKSLSEIPD